MLLAAQHLNWLILAIPLNTALFRGGETKFSRAELNRHADEAVRIFLAAYATPAPPHVPTAGTDGVAIDTAVTTSVHRGEAPHLAGPLTRSCVNE